MRVRFHVIQHRGSLRAHHLHKWIIYKNEINTDNRSPLLQRHIPLAMSYTQNVRPL